MTTLKLEQFAGEIPRMDSHLLAPNQASASFNTKLFSGALKSWFAPKQLKSLTLSGTVKTIHRLTKVGASDIWFEWNSIVHVVHSPLVGDVLSRVYYTGDGVPKQTWYDLISGAQPGVTQPSAWKRLGVPQPAAAPTVTPSGGTASNVTRFYTYTYVTALGEEGPPAVPTKATGSSNGMWAVAGMSTGPVAEYNVSFKRIYRTVVGETGVDFFFVAEVAVATASYNDTTAESVVALNETLKSQLWFPPPDDLQGLVEMPNGMMAGFAGNDIYFCEPYQFHAWPEIYRVSVAYPIVGLGVVGSSLVAATEGTPYVLTGVDPAAMSMLKLDIFEPCVSVRGIASTPQSVLYPSPNGLVAVSPGGVSVVTRQFYTREEWRLVQPELLFAGIWDGRYMAVRDVTPPSDEEGGLIFDPLEARAAVTQINVPFFTTLYIDHQTGTLYGVHRDLGIVEFDADTNNTLFFTWKSKLFVTPRPVNFGAARIDADLAAIDDADELLALQTFVTQQNALLYAALPHVAHTIGGFEVNQMQAATTTVNYAYPFNWTAPTTDPALAAYVSGLGGLVGGSRLIPQPSQVSVRQVLLEIWAGGQMVYNQYVADHMVRLPSGFKSDHWQVALSGNFAVYSVAMAETGKELALI